MNRLQALSLYLAVPAAIAASIEAVAEPERQYHWWVGGLMIAAGLSVYFCCTRRLRGNRLEEFLTVAGAGAMCIAIAGVMLFVTPVVRAKLFEVATSPSPEKPPKAAPDASAGTSVSVIFDSRARSSPLTRRSDYEVISHVAEAVYEAARRLPQPVLLRYDAVRAQSISPRPACVGQYRENIMSGSSGETIDLPRQLRGFLRVCTERVFSDAPEGQHNVPAAIAAAARATEIAGPGIRRIILVISDFRFPDSREAQFEAVDLRGVRVILLYRQSPEDAADPVQIARRMAEWTANINRAGASVVAYDQDSALVSSNLSQALQRLH